MHDAPPNLMFYAQIYPVCKNFDLRAIWSFLSANLKTNVIQQHIAEISSFCLVKDVLLKAGVYY